MPSAKIEINFDVAEEMLESPASNPKEYLVKLINFLKGVESGNYHASIKSLTDDTALANASGTITCATVLADDTVTINGVTLTGKSSPSGESQFDSDGSDTVVATAIAACINANSSLTGIVTATSSGAVVTVTASQSGLMGNAITLASSGATLAVSAARLASGTGAGEAAVSFSFGK